MRLENRIALSKVRLDNAKQLLASAQTMIDAKDYKSAANRSYYAVFNAMRAELAILGIDHKKHTGVSSDFRKHFIKTGIFENEMSATIKNLFEVSTQSDYDDFFIISKEEVSVQLQNAVEFVSNVEKHLQTMYFSE